MFILSLLMIFSLSAFADNKEYNGPIEYYFSGSWKVIDKNINDKEQLLYLIKKKRWMAEDMKFYMIIELENLSQTIEEITNSKISDFLLRSNLEDNAVYTRIGFSVRKHGKNYRTSCRKSLLKIGISFSNLVEEFGDPAVNEPVLFLDSCRNGQTLLQHQYMEIPLRMLKAKFIQLPTLN